MNKDDWLPRDVAWSRFAPDDLVLWKISKREWRAITDVITEIAATKCVDAHSAVARIQQTGRAWFRAKLTEPSQIRIVFSLERGDRVLLVHAVMRRTEGTYGIVQTLFEIAEAGAA